MTQPQPHHCNFDSSRRRENLSLDLSQTRRLPMLPFGNVLIPVSTASEALLNTPDLEKFKLATPDVEKFLTHPHALEIPSTSGTDFWTSAAAMDDQKANKKIQRKSLISQTQSSAHGSSAFEAQDLTTTTRRSVVTIVKSGSKAKATELNEIQSLSSSCSGGDFSYDNSSSGSDGGSGSWSQQDSQDGLLNADGSIRQSDKVKLERKRHRNRLAASKCRSKKLEKIANLEDKRTGLVNENAELEKRLAELQGNVFNLKSRVEEHANAGCSISIRR